MISAMVGRLMWHTNEVWKMRRKFFGKKLLPDRRRHGLHRRGFGVVVGAGATDGNGTQFARLSRAARVRVLFMRWFAGETRQARLSA